jgi:hypothetical protein
MISNKFMAQVRICGVILGLLPQPAVQADTDQLQSALIQTEASLKSLEEGDTPGAAAHAEAARSHVEIAARDATGQTLRDLTTCQKQLKDAEQRAKNDQRNKAKVAATQAREMLKGWVKPDPSANWAP